MSGRLMSAMLLLMVGIMHPLWKFRGRLRIKLSEASIYRRLLDIVRIVAFGTYPPSLLATGCPHTCPLAVYAISPVAVDLAVALSTKFLWLVKADFIAAVVYQFVPVCPAVAIKAPYSAPAML